MSGQDLAVLKIKQFIQTLVRAEERCVATVRELYLTLRQMGIVTDLTVGHPAARDRFAAARFRHVRPHAQSETRPVAPTAVPPASVGRIRHLLPCLRSKQQATTLLVDCRPV